MIISGQYNLQSYLYKNTSVDAFSYEDDEIIVVSDTSYNPNLPETVGKNYKKEGLISATKVNQMYLFTIFDKKKKELSILSDLSTSKFEVYYTTWNGVFYYSTSLKDLLMKSGIERVLNVVAAKEFLINHYLIGDNTLIENVYKLKPLHVLKVKSSVKQEKVEYILNSPSFFEARRDYEQLLREMVKLYLSKDKVSMPLSSGYDTSFILDTVLNENYKEIDAFCVGSLHGNNEVPDVEETCKQIPEINLSTDFVTEANLEDLANIVWRLEGIVYETGIFLQYVLAKLVSRKSISYLLCGECNDEVQSPYYLDNMKDLKDEKLNDTNLLSAISNPYLYSSRVIQKKSAVLLNSFGIQSVYPFVDKRLMEVAYALKSLNGKRKWYFKWICKKHMRKVLSNRMRLFRVGGTTGINSIASPSMLKEIDAYVKQSPLIQEIDSVKIGFTETELSKTIKKEQERVNRIKRTLFHRKPIYEHSEEPLLKLYLLVFNELFVSRNYDNYLSQNDLPLKTSDVVDFHFVDKHNQEKDR